MNRDTDQVIKLLASETNVDNVRKFLFDIMTPKELLEVSNRWKAAKMLTNRSAYSDIEIATGLSSATIARISKWLKSGNKGYQIFLENLEKLKLE